MSCADNKNLMAAKFTKRPMRDSGGSRRFAQFMQGKCLKEALPRVVVDQRSSVSFKEAFLSPLKWTNQVVHDENPDPPKLTRWSWHHAKLCKMPISPSPYSVIDLDPSRMEVVLTTFTNPRAGLKSDFQRPS